MKHSEMILAGERHETALGSRLSPSPGCECTPEDGEHAEDCPCHEYQSDGWFSHSDCELCGGLAGQRYWAAILPAGFPETGDAINIEVCGCCLVYIANGDLCDCDE